MRAIAKGKVRCILRAITAVSMLIWVSLSVEAQASFVKELPVSTQIDLLFTEVKIKNKTFKLLIDTGSPCILFSNAAEQINFQPKKRVRISDSNGAKKKVRVGNLPQLNVGGVEFKSVKFIVMDFEGPILGCLDFDGIIGANLMDEHVWQFDLQHRKMRISSKIENLSIDSMTYRVPLHLKGWQRSPYFSIRVNGHTLEALFDSGFSGFCTLSAAHYTSIVADNPSALRTLALLKGLGNEGALGSSEQTTRIINLDSIRIARQCFHDISVQLDYGSKTKIGSKYLKDRLVTFDFINERLYIEESVNAFDSFSLFSFGITLGIIEEQMVIGSVVKDSQADQLGLVSGDVLVQIDGQEIDSSALCTNFFERKDYLDSRESIEVQVCKGDQVKSYLLTKQKY